MLTLYPQKPMTQNSLILWVAAFLILVDNIAFFTNVLAVYPLTLANLGFLLSLCVFSYCFTVLLLLLLCFRYTTKFVLSSLLLVASITNYFMMTYNNIIDVAMLDNIVKTDLGESLDLFSTKMLVYLILLGILPAIYVWQTKLTLTTCKRAILTRLKCFILALSFVILIPLVFSKQYSSFFREHKILRYYLNPGTTIISTARYFMTYIAHTNPPIQTIGLDAFTKTPENRRLIIVVVGESARADRFSLNGYPKITNPLLANENIISFKNVWSCGTATAYSVPCMFSAYDHNHFSKLKAQSQENVLDIIQHAGGHVLWLDNNSSSKGVADRVENRNYKSMENNQICDVECRDLGMISPLQDYIDQHPQGNILVVLHQMGNHGPAYAKRYPKQFSKFTPICMTNELAQCSQAEINNAYDNAILYTDYFLNEVIKVLKNNDDHFQTALLYASDHGESLGEHHLFLHGMPNLIAPDEQKHIPMLLWLGSNFPRSNLNLQAKQEHRYTHDHIFHTLLGLMQVKTSLYQAAMDITSVQKKG